jgi:hypothetical protein
MERKTPYIAALAIHVDKLPPALRAELRDAKCSDCSRPVLVYGPSYDRVESAVGALDPVCEECMETRWAGMEEIAVVSTVTPRVAREFAKAEAERN